MVAALRMSLDELTVPECRQCRREMKWYRSELTAEQDSIAHSFYCSTCGAFSKRSLPLGGQDRAGAISPDSPHGVKPVA